MGAVFGFTLNIQAPSLRLIADRTTPPNRLTAPATATQAMSRTSHTAMWDMTDIALVLGNYYARNWNGGSAPAADTAPGAAATVTASVEYPAGVFLQMKAGGNASMTVPDGDLLVTDTKPFVLAKGTQFWTTEYRNCSAGIVNQSTDYDGSRGDRSEIGTSGITDKTMGGTIANSGTFTVFPAAILGTSTKPAVALVGTSIAAGVGGTLDPGTMLHGFENWLTAVPRVNLAQGGASTLGWIADHPIHQKLLQYCTAMVTDHGTNDYYLVDTATAISRLQTLYALMPGKQIFQTTILPRVTDSSDGFTTLNGQTTPENFHAARVALNVAIRAGFAGMSGYFDTDSVLESSFESGLYRVSGDGHGNTAPYTLDGTHLTQAGQYLIRDSGVVDQSRFT